MLKYGVLLNSCIRGKKSCKCQLVFHIAQTCCKTHRFFQSNVAHMLLQHERILYTMGLEAHIEDMDKLLNTNCRRAGWVFCILTFINISSVDWKLSGTFQYFSPSISFGHFGSCDLVVLAWPRSATSRSARISSASSSHDNCAHEDLLLQQGFRCNRHKMLLKESAFDETPFHSFAEFLKSSLALLVFFICSILGFLLLTFLSSSWSAIKLR